MLQGKKTYVTAAGGVLTAIGGWLSGAMTLPDALNLLITSILAATVRNAIQTTQ